MTIEYELPELTTDRTYLTVVRLDQAPLLCNFYQENRAFLAPWEPIRPEGYYELPALKMRIIEAEEKCFLGQAVHLTAFNRDRTEIIGVCNFTEITRGVLQACYLGYSLAEKYQGQGFMSEILRTAIPFMFEEWDLHRIMASYMPKNARSARVLETAGFEQEGLARDYLKIAGRWEDHVLMAKINREFQ
jgi:ribosomal-protein-alanine N-acetyltransferase